MFGSVVALLLINTFYCSFGHPLEINETLGKSLQLLADTCQNNFLSIQIKNHIEACDITLPAEREIKEIELECLIFYDINSQLCTALRGSKFKLQEKYDLEVNQAQKVDKTCTEASKNWKFTNLTVYPKYYNTSQKVLKTLVKCLQACGVDDLLSEETNFFCKYFQWGSELLQQLGGLQKLTDASNGGTSAASVTAKTTVTMTNSSSIPNSTKGQGLSVQSQPDNLQNQAQNQLQNEAQNQIEFPRLENIANGQLPENVAKINNESQKASKSSVKKESQMSVVPLQTNSTHNNTEKILVSNESNKLAIDLNQKPIKEDQPGDTMDDNDESLAYDSGDPLDESLPSGTPGNDANDPSLDLDNKAREEKNYQHGNVVSNVGPLDVSGSQKDIIYSNTMSDQFGDVDDHFFSFFLTATILVILFYVLYHNKSKFRKVFLGLLVEGRQSGRRRNSRGHEYRRLDTLEQAMSTNSTAPPSKIIY